MNGVESLELYDTAIVHALFSIPSTAYTDGGIVKVKLSSLNTSGRSEEIMLEHDCVLLKQ